MKPIAPQFRDASDYILGAFLLLVSIVVILLGSRSAFNTLRISTLTIYSYLEQPLASFKSYKSAIEENTRLRQQNVLLQDELNRLRAASFENERLRKLLNFKADSPLELYPTLIIGKELTGIHNFLTLETQENAGIEKGMPVVNENGLIGQIVQTAGGYAQVMPFFSNLYRVSAVIHGKNAAYGLVSWEGNNYQELVMNYVPVTQDIQLNDIVVTSGYSNIYPANIPIGQVIRKERNPGQETQRIYLEPFVSLFDLTEAFVIKHKPDSSRTQMIRQFKTLFNE